MDTAVLRNSVLDKYTYNQIKENSYNFFYKFNVGDQVEKFKQVCENILNGKENINRHILKNVIFYVMNNDPKQVTEIIFDVLNKKTLELRNKINMETMNDIFTIKSFNQINRNYYIKMRKLLEILKYYDDNTKTVFNGSKIYYMSSHIFYTNIINQKYKIGNKELYLYDVFTKLLVENATIDFNEIRSLFKMYSFYVNFSNGANTIKEILNKELDIDVGSDKTFIQRIVSNINDTMISYTKVKEKNVKNDYYKKIDGILETVGSFKERELFNFYYQKYLEGRLLSNITDLTFEKRLTYSFKNPKDKIVVKQIFNKINDIEEREKNNMEYRNMKLKVQFNEETMKKIHESGITKEQYLERVLNRNNVNVTTLREGTWSNNKSEFNPTKLPQELGRFVGSYEKGMYNEKYPYRKLNWNLDSGKAVTRIEIGGKVYYFQVTIPQLLVILQFNNNKELSAIDIEKNLGVPLAKLGPILTSLLKSKLIVKDDKALNDPNMMFSINKNFVSTNDKISLIYLTKETKKQNNTKNITDKKRQDMLLMTLVKMIKQHPCIGETELIKLVCDKISVKEDVVKNVIINILCDKKYIVSALSEETQEAFYEYCPEDSDSSSEA